MRMSMGPEVDSATYKNLLISKFQVLTFDEKWELQIDLVR